MSIEIKVPVLPESVADAIMMEWHKNPGDSVRRDENLVDIETEKVVLEVPAPVDGVLQEIKHNAGDTVLSQQVIAILEPGEVAATSTTAEPAVAAAPVATETTDDTDDRLSPAVRRLIEEHGIDVNAITATGPNGRILKEDVLNYFAEQASPKQSAPEETTPSHLPAPVVSTGAREERREPMSRLRKTIASRLVDAQQTAALLTTFNEVDLHEVKKLRSDYRDAFEKKFGVRLGFMSFFVKASIEALKRFPAANAFIDGGDIVYHDYYDIGIAVSSPRGLVVPILRDVDQKSFAHIESDINEFGRKAKDGALTMDELTGGTFTITNGGVFGSMLSTPIINPPQSAILGMHNILDRPMAINGEAVIRPMMYLALTYDHRIIDGREAVQFLVTIKESLENPARMLLGV